MKTQEEPNLLKEEVEALNKKLHELTKEELKQVSGGLGTSSGRKKKYYCGECEYVKCTFTERTMLELFQDEECPQCGAMNSFKVGDA